MAYWASRGLRGSTLEQFINSTNASYINKGLGLVQKIPTPIVPLKINSKTKVITSAYFEQKSTVDYIGVVQGIPICFDVKETKVNNFPLKNIHKHQMEFMESFEKQKGVAFILISFTSLNETYYVPFRTLQKFFERSINGRKSIKSDELDKKYIIKNEEGFLVHYLKGLNTDLVERNY